MREITYGDQKLDLTPFSDLSTRYDKTGFEKDTEYVTIDSAVLGNRMGLATIEGIDQSSALAAIHGRKYNNGRISIPFPREYVSEHYSQIDQLIQGIADKASSQCAALQQMMTPDQVMEGREVSMRSQAIREARTELLASGAVIDAELFNRANRSVRGFVASKVYYQHGVSVSARRVQDQVGMDNKGLFKRKNISSESGASMIAYVATADESGLKKVPIMTKDMRDKAEKFVYDFALVCLEAVKMIDKQVSGDSCLACLKEIYEKMPNDGTARVEIPDYSDDEWDQIETWKEEIIAAYRS